MASPATTQTVRPLDGLHLDSSGPPELTGLVAEHLRLLGARTEPEPAASNHVRSVPGARNPRSVQIALTGDGFGPQEARVTWADPSSGSADEATVQAATGIMAVHGRREESRAVWLSTTPPPRRPYSPSKDSWQGCWGRPAVDRRHGWPRAPTGPGCCPSPSTLPRQGPTRARRPNSPQADRRSPRATAPSSNWRPWTRVHGLPSGGPWMRPPTRYGQAGGPSSSGTPRPAHPSHRHCTRPRAPSPGSGSGRRHRSPAPRSARWGHWLRVPPNTTAAHRGHSPLTQRALAPRLHCPLPYGRWRD